MFSLKEADLKKMAFAGVQLGDKTLSSVMKPYIHSKATGGANIIDLKQTWNHLLLAARILAGISNPADICVVSSNPMGTRAVLKFALFTGATAIAGRYTPGTLTNQIQKAFKEPRILVLADPILDHRILRESAYVGIPVISFCNANANLKYVDLAIPCNNNGAKPIGLMWWLLAREVIRFRGHLNLDAQTHDWGVMPDLFMHRDLNEDDTAVREIESVDQPQTEVVDHVAPATAAPIDENNLALWDTPEVM